jgi:hypothetical protein
MVAAAGLLVYHRKHKKGYSSVFNYFLVKRLLQEVFYPQRILTLTMSTLSRSFALVLVALSLTCLVIVPAVISAETQVSWTVQTVDENGTVLPMTDSSQSPETQWNKTFDFYSGDLKHCAIQTSDGGYAVIGVSGGYYSSVVLAFAKVDPRGRLVWEQKISSLESAGGVVQTSDGGYVIAGNKIGRAHV